MNKLFFSIDSSYSGAYVLNALSPREQRGFERAMGRSESLRAEVDELQDTAVLLGNTIEPVAPPASLRGNLLAALENTPQLEPERAVAPERPQQLSFGEYLHRARMILIPATMSLAAAAVAVAIILPAQQQQTSPTQQAISTVLQAEDSQRTHGITPQGSTLTVAWSLEKGHAIAAMKGGYPLPSTKTYELWVTDREGNTRSAGLITNQHTSPQLLRGKVQKGDTVRLTVEPVKGSSYPTTKPIMTMKI